MQSSINETYDAVLEKCSKEEAQQLKLYKGRWLQALKSSATNSADVNTETKCKKTYEDLLESLYAKYFKTGRVFSSGTEAVEFLQSKDYKIAKSKFYNDIKAGHISKVSGKYYEEDLLQYARNFLQRNTTTHDDKGLQEEKLWYEVEMMKIRKEKEEFEKQIRQGEFVEKVEVREMLARRAAVFRHDMLAVVYDSVPELVKMSGGKTDAVAQAITFLKSKVYDVFRRYKQGRVEFDPAILEEIDEEDV